MTFREIINRYFETQGITKEEFFRQCMEAHERRKAIEKNNKKQRKCHSRKEHQGT